LFWGSIIKNHQKIYRLLEAVRKTLVLGLYNNKTHQKIYRLGELSRKPFFWNSIIKKPTRKYIDSGSCPENPCFGIL
jgi:hypothetical protein